MKCDERTAVPTRHPPKMGKKITVDPHFMTMTKEQQQKNAESGNHATASRSAEKTSDMDI